MKLFQIMRRRSDKPLCEVSFTSSTMGPAYTESRLARTGKEECKSVRIWLGTAWGERSLFRVEMDRGEAMQLRDQLNRWFPVESNQDFTPATVGLKSYKES